MRDFRDAKAMAQTLRDSLTSKAITVSHSESLELVSKMLGVSDWNTLSALLHADRRETVIADTSRPKPAVTYPALPLRDLVPFPSVTYPLFVGREKTRHALHMAFQRQREVVLLVQKDATVDEPVMDDLYDVGVLGRLLDLQPLHDGTLKVPTQIYRRVRILNFAGEAGAYTAEIADISEGPIPDATDLIKLAAERFEVYASDRKLDKRWSAHEQTRDPGRVADIIASHLIRPIADKQSVLATFDPVARLEQVVALMDRIP